MLDLFRKNTKVIIWSVIIAFVLWGGFSVGTQFREEGRYAGKVFDKNISFQEFDRFYRSSQLFNSSEDVTKNPDILRQSAWQGIVFSREAKRLKIDVSDSEVREQVLKILDQQKMNPDNYRPWVEQNLRLSPQQFETMVREMLRIQKLFIQLAPQETALKITPEEVKKIYFEEKDQIAAEFVRFPDQKTADAFRDKLKTPDDWKKEKELKLDSFKNTGGLVPSSAFSAFLQLNPADSLKVQLFEKNHFSEVLGTGKEFAVFFITDRVRGDEKEFEAQKAAYTGTLQERKRQGLLMEKTREVLERAHLTDYVKRASETPR